MIKNKLLALACCFCIAGAAMGIGKATNAGHTFINYETAKGEIPSVIKIPADDVTKTPTDNGHNAFASSFQLLYGDMNFRTAIANVNGTKKMSFFLKNLFEKLDKQVDRDELQGNKSMIRPIDIFPKIAGFLGIKDYAQQQNATEISKNILLAVISEITKTFHSTAIPYIEGTDPFSFRTNYLQGGRKYDLYHFISYDVPAQNSLKNISEVIDTCFKTADKKPKTIDVFPKSLYIELNRFSGAKVNEKDTMKNAPINLEQQLAFNEKGIIKKYQLTGILSHSGDKMSTGHFVTYIRHGNDWYLCDDTAPWQQKVIKLTPDKEGHINFPNNITQNTCMVLYTEF